jgi:hypothetical protein
MSLQKLIQIKEINQSQMFNKTAIAINMLVLGSYSIQLGCPDGTYDANDSSAIQQGEPIGQADQDCLGKCTHKPAKIQAND